MLNVFFFYIPLYTLQAYIYSKISTFLCAPGGDLFFCKGNRRFQTAQALLRGECAAKSSSPDVERIFRHSLVRIVSVTF